MSKLVQPHKNTPSPHKASVEELEVESSGAEPAMDDEGKPANKNWDQFFRNLRRGKK